MVINSGHRYALCIFSVFFVSFSFNALAQSSVTYHNKEGKKVKKKEAYYIRAVKPGEGGTALFDLEEHYVSGQLRRTGKVSKVDDTPFYEGQVIAYAENGQKISEELYQNNKLEGESSYYYPNGQPKMVANYRPVVAGKTELDADRRRIVSYYDSLGTPLVENGNGHLKEQINDTDVEEGEYQEGVREGMWKGTFLKGKYQFAEQYDKGELVRGESKDSQGAAYPYTSTMEQPQYPGGIDQLLRHVASNYRYSKEAVENKVSGTVLVSFVIDTVGRSIEIKVLKDLGYGTGPAAVSVIKSTQNWVPGKLRGVPVRVSHTLPIRLNARSD